MKLRGVVEAYFRGWFNFVGSLFYLIPWFIIVGLPFNLAGCLQSDPAEGGATGIATVHVVWGVLMLTWVPWICYELGMLKLDFRWSRRPEEQTDPEIDLLRRIIRSQDARAADDDEADDEN